MRSGWPRSPNGAFSGPRSSLSSAVPTARCSDEEWCRGVCTAGVQAGSPTCASKESRRGSNSWRAVEVAQSACPATTFAEQVEGPTSPQHPVVSDRQGHGGSHRRRSGGPVCRAVAQGALQLPGDTLRERDRGTPQRSAVPPVSASMFLHYAFDTWSDRAFPTAQFERRTEDAVAYCVSERQAGQGPAALGDRHDRRPLRWSARSRQAAQDAEQVQVQVQVQVRAAEVHRVRRGGSPGQASQPTFGLPRLISCGPAGPWHHSSSRTGS